MSLSYLRLLPTAEIRQEVVWSHETAEGTRRPTTATKQARSHERAGGRGNLERQRHEKRGTHWGLVGVEDLKHISVFDFSLRK